MKFLPPTPPRLTKGDALSRLVAAGHAIEHGELVLLGIRGYRHANHADNERSIYDDAACIIGQFHYSTYSFNTDPSVYSTGIATLILGEHWFKPGFHRKGSPSGHPAFRPATTNEELPVSRDNVIVPWPGVAINIHRGGKNTTSSAGCQTVPPDQWAAFYATMMDQLKRANQKAFRYILIQ